MIRFSANLGFLWTELTLPDAIHAAKRAGFDAVELHWPYDTPAADVAAALDETGLPVMGLNTLRGVPGENGLSALPGREAEARAAIDQAIDYAQRIGARNVHVMPGFAQGPEAHETFLANLDYACGQAAPQGMTILIEPLNTRDAPGYFLTHADQAARIIAEVPHDSIKMMFDAYHLEIMDGHIPDLLARHLEIIGHIQIAALPDRGPPDHGDLDYEKLFRQIAALGWTAPIGAEYRPGGPVEDRLDWMTTARKITTA